MAELKTQPNDGDVDKFLDSVPETQREDCHTIVDIMSAITKQPPRMWGDAIIGFGDYHYRYASGREGDWFLAGFSPRKQAISLYLMGDFPERTQLLEKLGKHKTGKACIYVKRLEDIHLPTLKQLVRKSIQATKKANR